MWQERAWRTPGKWSKVTQTRRLLLAWAARTPHAVGQNHGFSEIMGCDDIPYSAG